LEITCADFDGALYHISTNAEKTAVTVSLQWGCADQLLSNGGREDLNRIYGSYMVDPEPNYHVSLSLNLECLPADQKAKGIIFSSPSSFFFFSSFPLFSSFFYLYYLLLF
jgi:actin related protein 2/3 complex, subunit 2